MERHLTLFHSLGYLNEIHTLPGRKVWLPDIPESEIYMEHLLSQTLDFKGKYFIEDCLPDIRPKFPEADIRIFSTQGSDLPADHAARIILYPQSDTLAASVHQIYRKLDPASTRVMVPRQDKEGAGTYLAANQIPYEHYSFSGLTNWRPHLLVVLNDWTKEAQRIMAHGHWLGVPVICIQESVIDFGDSFHRMEHADYAFIQGSSTYSDLPRELLFITGNPRYEGKESGRFTRPDGPVLINCNFTYDIHENERYSWLDQVTRQLDSLGMKYQITQHPRDRSDLSRYRNSLKTRTGSVHEMIRESSLLITRFSSLIHESLIMGIPVIYYNPHRETMHYDFESNDSFLQLALSENELRKILLDSQRKETKADLNAYLTRHCLPHSSAPSDIIAYLLARPAFFRTRFSMKDLVRIMLFLPAILGIYSRVKAIFIRRK
jgi:hypothetical protein